MHPSAVVPVLLLLASAVAPAACRCGDEPPPSAAVRRPPPAAPRPTRAPVPPPTDELRPARNPVLSTAVPEGFLPEERTAGEISGVGSPPWVHFEGRAPVQAVLDFYTRYLDPGTPVAVGTADGGAPCAVRAVRARPGCAGGGRSCAEEVCLDPGPGRAWEFREQHPRPPGAPEALVNVRVMRVGRGVRVTIENETLLRIIREHAEADGPPRDPDLSQYGSFEEIPPELIQ